MSDLKYSDKALAVAGLIRTTREQRGISQKEMAFKLDMAPAVYNRLERKGQGLRLEVLFEIGDVLDVHPAVFLGLPERSVTLLDKIDGLSKEKADMLWLILSEYVKSVPLKVTINLGGPLDIRIGTVDDSEEFD